MNSFKKSTKRGIKKLLGSFGFKIQRDQPVVSEYTGASKVLESKYGHFKSKESQRSVDANNDPLPWFTYPAIEYLNQLDLSEKSMLEWGAGNSSLFFAKRIKELYSIEHNLEWFEMVKNFKIPNHAIFYAESDYTSKPSELGLKVDVVLIDGIEREGCSKATLELLNKGGMIILDNSDRHPDVAAYFRENGFIEVDFHGFGPINDYTWTTSIFLDRAINLQPLTIQPTIPIGGGF